MPPHPPEPGAPGETGTPRGHGTKAEAPREGNPTDIRQTHQTGRHTHTPRSTYPASRTMPNHAHQPQGSYINRARNPQQQNHQSDQRRRHPTPDQGVRLTHRTARHSETRRSTTQRNKAHHTATQHTTVQGNAARHLATRHSTARHGAGGQSRAQAATARQGMTRQDTARHGTARQSRAQRSTARSSATQHSKAQHSVALHTKAHHKTRARNASRRPGLIKPSHNPERKETRPQPWDPTTAAHHAWAQGHHTPDGTTPPPQRGRPKKLNATAAPGQRRPACTNRHQKAKPASTEPTPQGQGDTGQPHHKERRQPPPAPSDP